MDINTMITNKENKIKELRTAIISAETVEQRTSINETITALEQEIVDLRSMQNPAQNQPEGRMNPVAAQSATKTDDAEARAKKFAETNNMTISNKEARAEVLVSGGTIAQPTGVDGINGLYPQVSSIVDMVKIVDASGMGAGYKIAYQKTDAEAAAHTEGGAITESEPTFGIVTITAADKALVSYISNKVRKQSPLTYEAKVKESAMTALRKAASKMCVDAVYASDIVESMEISLDSSSKGVLDEKFLRKITLNYGGDEAVMGGAVLFINKKDLIALGDVRGSDKKPVYEITPDASNPNTGIIKDGGLSVRYCINNNCAALAGTAQPAKAAGDVLGCFYGNPQALELAMFGDYEVATSEDYKFANDMLTVRGTASMGAGVGTYKSFVVCKIAASAT